MKAISGLSALRSRAVMPCLAGVMLLALGGCQRSQPPAAAPPAAPTSTAQAPAASTPDANSAAPAPAPQAKPAAVRAPRTPLLIQHAGDPTGPIAYLVLEPANAAPDLPVVIALHGRGDRAEQFARLAEGLQVPVRFVVARAPLPFGPSAGKQWFDSDSPEVSTQIATRVEELVGLADRVHTAWPEAPKPLLLGFSQGAMLAIQAVARHPGRFGAAVALSGFLPLEDGNAKAASAVPMLLSVGRRDTIIAPERTQSAAKALEALGHQPEILEFEGGHSVPKPVVARVRTFLREHTGLPAEAPGAAPSP
ncbi:MAG: alpha/beta hydrolase-fold protein [Myxococcota bacterium]